MKGFISTDILILLVALILDGMGLICTLLDFVGIGFGISFIPDLLGMFIIGMWTFFVKGDGIGFESAGKKFGIASGLELFPGVGDVSPSWTFLVIMEILKK